MRRHPIITPSALPRLYLATLAWLPPAGETETEEEWFPNATVGNTWLRDRSGVLEMHGHTVLSTSCRRQEELALPMPEGRVAA